MGFNSGRKGLIRTLHEGDTYSHLRFVMMMMMMIIIIIIIIIV
jgi:hypothetical protein